MSSRSAAVRQPGERATMLWIFGLAGGALLVWSVAELVARFVVRQGT